MAQNNVRDEIASRLAQQMSADAPQVQVDVVGDQVTLAGTVGSADRRAQAESIAKETSGVEFVINNLRVAQEGTTGATG